MMLAILLIWLGGAALVLLLRYRPLLRDLWREPVLCRPVLIFESDDWGPGEGHHAQRLQQLANTLARFRDANGKHPVTTLGMILAIPDGSHMQAEGGKRYVPLTLSDERCVALREVITRGVEQGVFAIQLHGKEHYWPPALMRAAQDNSAVATWLQEAWPRNENLPAPLQSRWIDGAVLPSQALDREAIEAAARDEVELYARVFFTPPEVVVPPTFVWTREVERAWAANGLKVIVTPGMRFERRDAQGELQAATVSLRNAMTSAEGLIYIVRDDYFEPARGHRAERALSAVAAKTRCGRPTLLEMHRFNFIEDVAEAEHSCAEVARLLEAALHTYGDLRFMTTAELAHLFATQDLHWVELSLGRRLHVWTWRVSQELQLWRALRLTGIAVIIFLLRLCTPRQR